MQSLTVLLQDFSENILLYGAIFVLSLCLIVFLHEMGHYCAARLFRVRITKFSLGFGPEVFGVHDKAGTRWALSRYPLGGYVEIFGYSSAAEAKIWDTESAAYRPLSAEEKTYAFCEKPLWQRAIIVAAGPAVNFLFSFIVIAALFMSTGERSSAPQVTAVAFGTPAYSVDIRPGDRLLEVNHRPITRFEDIWKISFLPYSEVDLTIERDGEVLEKSMISSLVTYKDKKGIYREHGRLGATNFMGAKIDDVVSINGNDVEDLPDKARRLLIDNFNALVEIEIKFAPGRSDIYSAFISGDMNTDLLNSEAKHYDFVHLRQTKDPFYVTHDLLGAAVASYHRIYRLTDESLRFISVLLQGRDKQYERLGGMVTMGKATQKAVDAGMSDFLFFLAVFSLQIGFINLLPVPVLDGGYLMFFLYEAIRGKPLPEKLQDYALSLGLLLLFGLMIFANINDILRFIS